MRQLGTLPNERDARRFAAWLTAQRIDAHAEQEQHGWVVWVRDEDRLPQAREALAHFREHPQDTRYQGAERSAEALIREEEAKRRQALSNVVQMRGRWSSGSAFGGGPPRRCPLVMVLIAISIIAAIFTNFGDDPPGGMLDGLRFVPEAELLTQRAAAVASGDEFRPDMWANIRRGEVWRLVTPIFVHYGIMHLAMNMLILFSLGGQIENQRGWGYMAILVLVLAAASNIAQVWEYSLRHEPALFGGMSGVGYGLFGYILVKVKFDNRFRYVLSPSTTFILLLWFFLCIGGQFPPLNKVLPEDMTHVANTAHAAGLAVGAAIAYVPLLARKPA